MPYKIPRAAAEILLDFASNFSTDRFTGGTVYGQEAVAREIGYGGETPDRAFRACMERRSMPVERLHRLVYLVQQTSDPTLGALRSAFPTDEWSRICRAVDQMRGFRPPGPSGDGERPGRKRGRPLLSERRGTGEAV